MDTATAARPAETAEVVDAAEFAELSAHAGFDDEAATVQVSVPAAAPLLPLRRQSPFAGDAAAIAFVWVAALSITLVVAAFTKIGPVVLTVSATHGLHVGDVVTGVVMTVLAVLATAVIAAQNLARRARATRRAAARAAAGHTATDLREPAFV